MLNLDIDDLWRYLAPKKKTSIDSKGVDSVVSQVINLSQINAEISFESVSEELKNAFQKWYPWCEMESIEVKDPLTYHPECKKESERFSSRQWIIGETPQFTSHLSQDFDWGSIIWSFKVKGGMIHKGTVSSDCAHYEFIEMLEEELNSEAYEYSIEGIELLKEVILLKYSTDELACKMMEELGLAGG